MRTVTVSIVLAAYNAEATIIDCLTSIASQTYRDFEIIIIDDGSDDTTPAIVSDWLSTAPFPIVHITNPTNLGLTKSLNIGIARARGRYIARIDADDTWHPHKLEQQLKFLKNNPSYGLIGSWYSNCRGQQCVDKRLPTTDAAIRRYIWQQNPFCHSCVVVKKSLLTLVGGYDESIHYGQDYDLWFRLVPHTRVHNIPLVLCKREHSRGLSHTHAPEQMKQSIKTISRYLRQSNVSLINYRHLVLPLLVYLAALLRNMIRYNRHDRISTY